MSGKMQLTHVQLTHVKGSKMATESAFLFGRTPQTCRRLALHLDSAADDDDGDDDDSNANVERESLVVVQ